MPNQHVESAISWRRPFDARGQAPFVVIIGRQECGTVDIVEIEIGVCSWSQIGRLDEILVAPLRRKLNPILIAKNIEVMYLALSDLNSAGPGNVGLLSATQLTGYSGALITYQSMDTFLLVGTGFDDVLDVKPHRLLMSMTKKRSRA